MPSRIQFGTPLEDRLPERSLPGDSVKAIVPSSRIVVLLDAGARKSILSHARRYVQVPGSRQSLECAGLLAGLPFYDPERKVTFVAVRHAVETNAVSQSAGSVQIAPPDFEQARHQIAAQGLRVVGWYHTHPSYGIFLSDDDRLVVRALFNASWHISLVYDPLTRKIGCFHGEHGTRVDDRDDDVPLKGNYIVLKSWTAGFWDNLSAPLDADISAADTQLEVTAANVVPALSTVLEQEAVSVWPPVDPLSDAPGGDAPGDVVPMTP